VPSGFRIITTGNGTLSGPSTIFWSAKVNPDTSRLIMYELEFFDNDTLGLDYFEPARLEYENETLYSERIPFIRQYIPEKKIFIQKKLRYSLADEIVVQLQVQNLGESSIRDLYIREFLEANDVFREISQPPEGKGAWRIPLIERGDLWEVTYVTNENKATNLLPEVYGVDRKVVLKTLVFENVVRNRWLAPTITAIEVMAPLFVIGFIIFYFVYSRRIYTKNVFSLKMIGRKIRKLKKTTQLSAKESIDLLKRESESKKEIPSVGSYHVPTKDSLRDMAHENIDKLKEIDQDTKKGS
jgi:hypothetical protein